MQSRKADRSEPAPVLRGQVSRVSIADLLTTLEVRGWSGVVRFQTPADTASVWFASGRLTDAEMGVLNGEVALFRILGLNQGTFEVLPEEVQRTREIHDTVNGLVAKRSKRAARWEDLLSGGPALDAVPVRVSASVDEESADESRLLSLVDGRRTLLEILDESRLDPVQALETLSRLRRHGRFLMEQFPSSRPPPPRPEQATRKSNPDLSGPTPPRTSTLMGFAAATPVPPHDPLAASSPPGGPRSVSALTGSVAPSWAEPPSGQTGAFPIDREPNSDTGGPDESGLTEKRLRAERESDRTRARKDSRPDSDWPRLDISQESPESRESVASDEPPRQSMPPSLPPTSGLPDIAPPGTQFGSYQVLLRLAHGMSSSVYLCREASQGSVRNLFAAKLISPHAKFSGDRERFCAAVNETLSLTHPSLTRLLGSGTHEGNPYVVSEYIEGCSLAAMLKRQQRSRPIPLMLAALFDVLRGLQAAHELGFCHGNLCPHDLLIGSDGVCRVSDVAVGHALRVAGAFELGSDTHKLMYAAPERLLGNPVDARSDVFSMGVILHDMLTGSELFGAATAEGVRSRVLSMPIEAPSRLGLRPPAAFDALCLKALERDPSERFASCRDLLWALEEAALDLDDLASSNEVTSWVNQVFGNEIELRRLSILDASRRVRGSRSPRSASQTPPPTDVATTALALSEPSLPRPTSIVPASLPPDFSSLPDSYEPPKAVKFPLSWIVAVAAVLGVGGLSLWLYRANTSSLPPETLTSPPMEPVQELPPVPPPADAESARPNLPSTPSVEPFAAAPAPAPEPASSKGAPVRRGRPSPAPRQRPGAGPAAAPEPPSAPAVDTSDAVSAPRPPTEQPPTPPPTPPLSTDSEFGYGI